jgi:hypothetical protein
VSVGMSLVFNTHFNFLQPPDSNGDTVPSNQSKLVARLVARKAAGLLTSAARKVRLSRDAVGEKNGAAAVC